KAAATAIRAGDSVRLMESRSLAEDGARRRASGARASGSAAIEARTAKAMTHTKRNVSGAKPGMIARDRKAPMAKPIGTNPPQTASAGPLNFGGAISAARAGMTTTRNR